MSFKGKGKCPTTTVYISCQIAVQRSEAFCGQIAPQPKRQKDKFLAMQEKVSPKKTATAKARKSVTNNPRESPYYMKPSHTRVSKESDWEMRKRETENPPSISALNSESELESSKRAARALRKAHSAEKTQKKAAKAKTKMQKKAAKAEMAHSAPNEWWDQAKSKAAKAKLANKSNEAKAKSTNRAKATAARTQKDFGMSAGDIAAY